jgi:hypothetical protein
MGFWRTFFTARTYQVEKGKDHLQHCTIKKDIPSKQLNVKKMVISKTKQRKITS